MKRLIAIFLLVMGTTGCAGAVSGLVGGAIGHGIKKSFLTEKGNPPAEKDKPAAKKGDTR